MARGSGSVVMIVIKATYSASSIKDAVAAVRRMPKLNAGLSALAHHVRMTHESPP